MSDLDDPGFASFRDGSNAVAAAVRTAGTALSSISVSQARELTTSSLSILQRGDTPGSRRLTVVGLKTGDPPRPRRARRWPGAHGGLLDVERLGLAPCPSRPPVRARTRPPSPRPIRRRSGPRSGFSDPQKLPRILPTTTLESIEPRGCGLRRPVASHRPSDEIAWDSQIHSGSFIALGVPRPKERPPGRALNASGPREYYPNRE